MFSDFIYIFTSICIEAFPFLFFGAFIASFIELFVTPERIEKLLPSSIVIQVLLASVIGVVFPICECAIIPIAFSLYRKSVPLVTVIVFMVSVPVLNLITSLTTVIAFTSIPSMLWYRLGGGFVVALLSGIVIHLVFSNREIAKGNITESTCGCSHTECGHNHDNKREGFGLVPFLQIIKHTKDEFFSIAGYLVGAAALTSIVQVWVPQNIVTQISESGPAAVGTMQLFGYAISLCSHADAFVASGFQGILPGYALLAFLLTSPVLDVKNTIILLRFFKAPFVIGFICITGGLVFLLSMIISFLGGPQ